MSGRFILAIPSSGLSAAGVIIRGVIVAETRGRRRGEGGGRDGGGGEWDGMVESGAVSSLKVLPPSIFSLANLGKLDHDCRA